ncbi:isocitrate lyase/PEP mutase family protein [Tuberibacillus sp. Marseille-P3662]|uniref:isocitrate lyase/PEP mutase family protein n=1 Tax=Tuberibacillus sp. Marseille-P3662 TaxID=1965358 RepID=UPI000A1C905F|nr:isocitrate lyase/phosphoenolpyruvate mutase family protein [Tuberibacillus sp. Marseille-P3662]
MNPKDQLQKTKHFHQLHQPGSTFVLPNAWDVISAKIFEESGFEAIGTTSAGIATSLGFKDGQNIPSEKMTEVIKTIADAVNVPVSADIEAGYGESAENVAKAAKKVLEAGAVGINLEDGTGNLEHPLYDLSLQKEKITAIKEFSDTTEGSSLFINARTDTYWLNIDDPSTRFQKTVERVKAFEEAGADCIFVPGLHDREIIQKLRKETNCPINLLVDPDMPNLSELSNLGIERVSCGSSPFRATVTLLKTISEEIKNQQTFHHMQGDVLSYRKVAKLVEQTS